MTDKSKVAYLANGLFSESDRRYNIHLATLIRHNYPEIDLYVPQENTSINDKSQYADSVQIATADNKRLDKADLLIVSLDNMEAGAGRAGEIGYACAKGIPIIGLYTDTRQQGTDNKQKINALKTETAENQFSYVNLYTVGLIKMNGEIVQTTEELIETIAKYI